MALCLLWEYKTLDTAPFVPKQFSTMGNTYKLMEAKQTADGYKEVLGYVDWQSGIYRLRLVNGKLTEWDYILPPAHRHNENRQTSN